MDARPKNVPGDFFVEDGCCTLCGVPWHIAPDLFSYEDSGCWVNRQPANTEELGRMIRVLQTQELDCIHYRGNDPKITKAIKDDET
jgi:hypothetical protein